MKYSFKCYRLGFKMSCFWMWCFKISAGVKEYMWLLSVYRLYPFLLFWCLCPVEFSLDDGAFCRQGKQGRLAGQPALPWALAAIQHLLFIPSWHLEVPAEIEALFYPFLNRAGDCLHCRKLVLWAGRQRYRKMAFGCCCFIDKAWGLMRQICLRPCGKPW